MEARTIVGVGLYLLLILPLLFIARYFLQGKGGDLISIYRSLPAEKKTLYDEKAICRFTGKCILFVFILCALLTVEIFIPGYYIGFMVITVLFTGTVAALIYAFTGGRFLKKH